RGRPARAPSAAPAGAEEPLAAAGAALSRALENQTRPVRTHAGDPAGPLPEASGPATEYWLSGPLSGRDGRPLGWIHLCCWGANFDDEDVPLLTQVAQMASIALENALASEAREANRLKDEFLATLSHELRTPLTTILGWTRILRTTAYDLQRTNHGLEVIERNVQAQARLIDDLLDVSRIIAGKLRLSLRPMAIVPAVETAIEAMRPAAEAKGVGLHLTVDPAIGRGERIDGDADRLQQVGWNLVSNAIKFTPAGGRIDVRLARSGDRFTVQVADTGKGISPSFLRHVFDRFRQADSTTTRSQGGLGIGLAIVSHIVEQHGGTVTAESGGLGQGATVTVTLPARTATAEDDDETFAERPAIEEAAAAATDLSPWRLLLVDDEVDAREVLSEVLQSFGAQVATAGSVAQALSRFAEEPPDVLISDIAMPGGDGYELLRRVRELPEERGGEVPAIALTAYAREEDRQRSFAAGFADHLAKPIEPLRLVAAVAAQATRAARASAAARTKRQVLVVEDDADSREALKTLLELSGYTVHTAETGPEGIEKALELKPHIAVVDIGLPEIDGHEVARRIRERLGSNSIFLVALTGYANESDLLRSRESGFNAHLAKPLELATLRRLLDGA
ncbi:MAG TPA: response regulator, partial [Thermoanaerobaculia bacterium]